MNIVLNNDIKKDQWLTILRKNPASSPFQSPELFDFFNSIDGFSAEVIGVEHEGSLESVVVVTVQKEKGLKAYFSRRGIIYGGPLFGSSESAVYLIDFLNKYYKNKLIYLETRNFFDYSLFNQEFENAGWGYNSWLNFQLIIDTEDQVKKNMSSSRWRQIKKAKKAGAYWQEAKSIHEVESFYNILLDLYKNKIKKPLPPFEFFQKFYSEKAGKYFLVFFEEKVIGGIMCPVLQKKAIYEFYVCGLDREYKDHYPSIMATWAAIEYALNNNIKIFDFMGAGSPDEAYGVREFKARFGGNEVEHGRFIKILNPFMYNLGKLGLKILSKI